MNRVLPQTDRMHLAAAVFLSTGFTVTAPSPTAKPTVCVQPLGAHDARLLPVVARGIEYLYGLEVRTLPERPLPASAWYSPRRRYRAEKILGYLDTAVVPGSGCGLVMGFTSSDISTKKGKHSDWGMLGYAWIGGPSGVVSTHRMGSRVSRRTMAMRAVKVMNHELGHALGHKHHAVRKGCLMDDVGGTVRTLDRESGVLCREERRALERLSGLSLPDRRLFDWRAIW